MRRKLWVAFLGSVLAGLAARAAQAAGRAPDACALLTRAELQTIQGATLRQAKPTRQNDGGLSVLQCFFDLDPFVRSVSVTLSRSEGPNGDPSAVRARWDRQFHSAPREEAGRPSKGEREREEGGGEPRPIPGIGQQAFWEPSRVGGALYVFEKDAFLRLAVGGAEDDAARLDRAVRLARKALRRM
ncbi:MAG: hypothetical protein LC796_12140 [Acidobacteria bacterium]|nr:hypothetical protein [Acidobacteriota bacterium]MCA1610871.1 hypothetical protein [Acidobacteriota bacterium]